MDKQMRLFARRVGAATLALFAVTLLAVSWWDSPLEVGDRSREALLTWSTYALAITTALLLIAAVWAGIRVGEQVRMADQTRRGAVEPIVVVVVAVAEDDDESDDVVVVGGRRISCRAVNVGPRPDSGWACETLDRANSPRVSGSRRHWRHSPEAKHYPAR